MGSPFLKPVSTLGSKDYDILAKPILQGKFNPFRRELFGLTSLERKLNMSCP